MDDDVQTCVTYHVRTEGYAGRIEVVTGPTGRRRWPEHVKAAIVLETFRDGVSVADVARRHGVSAPQLQPGGGRRGRGCCRCRRALLHESSEGIHVVTPA